MLIYVGIGSRRSPTDALDAMEAWAKDFGNKGWTLRSGAAEGADTAFERGALVSSTKPEIYLPWPTFNNRVVSCNPDIYFPEPTAEAYEMGARYHPVWDKLSISAKRLHARNCHQILGLDLKTPADLVVCWTPDGADTLAKISARTGGTGQALRIALDFNIPIFNLCTSQGDENVDKRRR